MEKKTAHMINYIKLLLILIIVSSFGALYMLCPSVGHPLRCLAMAYGYYIIEALIWSIALLFVGSLLFFLNK